ncbi:hypothetical protein KFU94_36235 [Chloroflexi bacterium TSY]|nr:hypothetical protein [Chloroflexi bacterium TSY]
MTATLTLEWLGNEGTRTLYPHPHTMSFLDRDQAFQISEANATAWVRDTLKLWEEGGRSDIRWRLTRKDEQPLFRVEGGSAGGAFALGVAALLSKTEFQKSPHRSTELDLNHLKKQLQQKSGTNLLC